MKKFSWGLCALMMLVSAEVALAGDSVTLVGQVIDTEDGGLVLRTDTGEYLLEGSVPIEMYGERVLVIGILEQTEDGVIYLIVEDLELAHDPRRGEGQSVGAGLSTAGRMEIDRHEPVFTALAARRGFPAGEGGGAWTLTYSC